MFIDDPVRLRHILDAATEAVSFAQNRTRSDLDTDRMLVRALVQCLEVIGEAASRITKERREELPQIPWSQMIGMRNRLVHAYFDIRLDVVWRTVTEDLPVLIAELENIIPPEHQE
ncbi:MAG: DUF86 domain-containing protein [Oscillatoria sp. Prado101]|jgi:uncharacterized protein with HEPN domain|nr:DUF86 domain-containing protein [Oscillatoria sp. Prado101]